MDQVIKAKWKKALTSGDYEQTTQALKNEDGFCCLGVLCDVYIQEKGIDWEKPAFTNRMGRSYLFGESTKLPVEVQDWAGLIGSNPLVGLFDLISLNDNKGLSFDKIAQKIDSYL